MNKDQTLDGGGLRWAWELIEIPIYLIGSTMDICFLVRGLVVGFSIAAPVGPIGVLCIRRTLAEGRTSGLVSGLGAATADAIYGCFAGFGLTFISSLLINQRVWIRVIGGVFLCYLALKIFFSRVAENHVSTRAKGLAGAYLSTFFLTLTNPMTILSFAGIFAGLGIASAGEDYASAGALVLGIFIGSSLWWLTLSSGVGLFRTRLTPRGLRWVNRLSSLIIMGFGMLALVGLFFR